MDRQFNLEKPISIEKEGRFESNLLVQTIIRRLVNENHRMCESGASSPTIFPDTKSLGVLCACRIVLIRS